MSVAKSVAKKMPLTDYIRASAVERGFFTQRSLARQLGLSFAAVSRLLRGVHEPSDKVLGRVAIRLGLDWQRLHALRCEQWPREPAPKPAAKVVVDDDGPVWQWRHAVYVGDGKRETQYFGRAKAVRYLMFTSYANRDLAEAMAMKCDRNKVHTFVYKGTALYDEYGNCVLRRGDVFNISGMVRKQCNELISVVPCRDKHQQEK